MELNKVLIIGNLTRDPETRNAGGSSVVKMGLASNRRFNTRDGEKREEVVFVDVEAWGNTGEVCARFLRKGSQLLVEGRLKLDHWKAEDGSNRSRIFIVADRVQFGAKPEGEPEPVERGRREADEPARPAQMPGYPGEADTDDGLPF